MHFRPHFDLFPTDNMLVLHIFTHVAVVCISVMICFGIICWKTTLGKIFATQMSPTVVETQYGKLRGVLVTLTNRNIGQVETYLGLQYASVLGGDLRFMPPTSTMEKWDNVRVALKYRPVCPQRLPTVASLEASMPRERVEHFVRLLPFLEKQQEECLYLNVYVPVKDKSELSVGVNRQHLLPVLVFIHGESYDLGSGNAYDGSAMAAYGQHIVITLNYRLGVLGFLSTGDSNAPGNYALLDQVAALRWIQENIKAFGGNASEVTLMGHGYGAAMVNILMISPVTKGRSLFHRVILQSGSALAPWAIVGDPLPFTHQLSDRVNCSHNWDNTPMLLHCLKQLPFEELLTASASIEVPRFLSAFGPTVDHRSVLPTDFRSMLPNQDESAAESHYVNVTVLTGFMLGEGLGHFNQALINDGATVDGMNRLFRTLVHNSYRFHRQTIYDVLLHQYRNWEGTQDQYDNRNSLVELVSDALYIAPIIEFALHHSSAGGNVRSPSTGTYIYCYNYTRTADASRDRKLIGASRTNGEDLAYVFGSPITDGIDPFLANYTRNDKSFSENLLRYWSNFVKTGSPNDKSSTGQKKSRLRPPASSSSFGQASTAASTDLIEWPAFDSVGQQFMVLDFRLSVQPHIRASRIALWLDLIPKIHRPDHHDPCSYHRLDNSDNLTIFDGNVLRTNCRNATQLTVAQQQQDLLAPLPVTTPSNVRPPGAHRSPHRSANPSSRPSTTVTASSRNLNNVNSLISRLLPPPTTTPTTTDAASSSSSPSDYSFSLVVVVGVGCILLAANIVLFSFVYCRKLKTWKDKSRMKCSHNNHHHHRQLLNQRDQFQQQQQQTEREMMNCDSRGEEDDDVSDKIERGSLKRVVKGPNNTTATPALDGNCSSSLYITPIPSHHHLYCQMTALTNSRSMHDT